MSAVIRCYANDASGWRDAGQILLQYLQGQDWSILGDGMSTNFLSNENFRKLFQLEDDVYRAPRIKDLDLPIDLSPFLSSKRNEELVFGRAGYSFPFSVERIQQVKLYLDEAAIKLQASQNSCFHFVKSLCKSLVIVHSIHNPTLLSSANIGARIGEVLLVIPEAGDVPCEFLVESLIHESIHQLLHLAGQICPFYHANAALMNLMVVSPWTSHKVSASSLFHACFVWYGIWQFWTHMERTHGFFEPQQIQAARLRAATGFLRQPPVLLGLDKLGVEFETEVVSIILDMQREVQTMHHHDYASFRGPLHQIAHWVKGGTPC